MTDQTHNRGILLLCAALLLVILAVDVVAVLRITNNHDFAVYHEAAVTLRSGGDIYAETEPFREQIEQGLTTKEKDTPWPYAYPPFTAAALLPLSFLPLGLAGAIWTALCLAALTVSMWLLMRSQGWLSLSGLVVSILLINQFDPAVIGLRLGQLDIIIFLLLVLAFWWLKTGRDVCAGAALGLAIGLKFFAGFVVAYLLWKRRWRAAIIAGVSGGILAFGSFVLVGLDGIKSYFSFSSLYTGGAFAGYPYHQSLNAIFTRMFKPNMFTPPITDLPWLADALTLACSALLLIGFLWLTRRPTAPSDDRFDLEYALALVTLLLVVPPAPRYAFVYLLLGFVVVAAQLVRGRANLLHYCLFALSFILSARVIYFPVKLLWRLFQEGQFMMSAVFLWILIAWLLWRPLGRKGDA